MTNTSLNIWLDPSGTSILLNADMALAYDITVDDNNVAINKVPSTDDDTSSAQVCSLTNPDGKVGCVNPSTKSVSTLSLVIEYTLSNKLFLINFAKAYVKMSSVGYGTKQPSLIPFVENDVE